MADEAAMFNGIEAAPANKPEFQAAVLCHTLRRLSRLRSSRVGAPSLGLGAAIVMKTQAAQALKPGLKRSAHGIQYRDHPPIRKLDVAESRPADPHVRHKTLAEGRNCAIESDVGLLSR